FIILWIFYLLLCVGCASKQLKVDLSYTPPERNVLDDLKPVVVSLQVVDHRPTEQQNIIGVQRNTVFGTKHADIISKTSVIDVVNGAIKTELERSGLKILNPEQGQGDITLIVWLKQLYFDSKASDVDIELVGSIRSEVVAFSRVHNVPQVSFTVEVAYRDFIQKGLLRAGGLFGLWGITFTATPKNHIENVLNGALTEFVRSFCREPKLRKILSNRNG
ncbi:MAG: hypothetical protein JSW66_11900, partial [Phycisphaerales bacterium]